MINLMKKGIALITIISYLSFFNVSLAANTHSIDLELSSSQYLSRLDTASLSPTTDLTLEIWANPETIDIGTNLIMKWNEVGNRSYYFQIDANNKLFFYIAGDGDANAFTGYVSDAAVLSGTGTWFHLAASFEAGSPSTIAMYKDGSAIDITSLGNDAEGIYDGTAPFLIGAYMGSDTPSGFFDGLIDEVRVWNDVRTSTEISDNMSVELVGNEAGLAGYWKLNNSLLDETANDNDLTNNNSAVFSTDVPFVGAVAEQNKQDIIWYD